MPKPSAYQAAAAAQLARTGAKPILDDEGKALNPHIPDFIGSAPWWFESAGGDQQQAGLAHQRLQTEEKAGLNDWLRRGKQAVVAQARTRFEPGACTNCGAKTHDAKNCLERPRKAGAWKTETDLRPDDVAQPTLKLSFDGVHDRYNGFDPEDDAKRIKQFKEVPMAKSTEGDDGDAGAAAAEGADKEKKKTVLPTSLRVRGDTAKYLRNLAPDSAYYDPKTRSMRGNPTPHLPPEELLFAGDNFVRRSGEVGELARTELFAQRVPADKTAASVQANPTEILMARREFEQRKDALKKAKKEMVLSRYGGAELLGAPKVAESTVYTEWTADGKLLRTGAVEEAPKSRFLEDAYDSNHTSVWGSFFDVPTMRWGYACCHQTVKNCWCTGEEGKRALKESRELFKPRT